MTSFAKANLTSHASVGALSRPRLSPLKWNTWPILLQVLASIGLAVAMIGIFIVVAPDTAQTLMIQLQLAGHEGGHALATVVQLGQVHEITLRADGSGMVASTSSDPVFTAGGGLLLPTLMAALLIISAVTRTGTDFMCLLVAIPLFWLGFEAGPEPVVRWSLWGWATFAALTALPGIPHVLKSAGAFAIGAVLVVGIIETIDYLNEEYVTVPSEQSLAGVAEMPSDIRIIADAFNTASIADARAIILLAMFTVGFVTACIIARFLIIYRKR